MPDTEDLLCLKKWCGDKMTKMMQKVELTKEGWEEAADIVLVRCDIFNKRRISEVAKIKAAEFKVTNRPPNNDVMSSLDITEQMLAKR